MSPPNMLHGVFLLIMTTSSRSVEHAIATPTDCVFPLSTGLISGQPSCDGEVNDTTALQAALSFCSQTFLPVVISRGANCTAGPLMLSTNTRFVILGRLQSVLCSQYPPSIAPFISASNTKNITITGNGIVDGRGAQWWPSLLQPKKPRPRLFLFSDVDDVLFENVTLTNAASNHLDIYGGNNYEIRYVTIRSPNYQIAPNTDGIDIAATRVHVHHVDISNGDDSICIKSPAHNVLVEDCTVRTGNGFVVGTSSDVAISNITFRNCLANDTTFGAHVKFYYPQAGFVTNVTWKNITIYQSKASWLRRVTHFDHAGYAVGMHLMDQGRRRQRQLGSTTNIIGATPFSNVRVTNITFRNIRADVLFAGEFVCGRGNLTCTGITMDNVVINASKNGCKFENAVGDNTGIIQPRSCAIPSSQPPTSLDKY
eukprot:m.168389 g.168389  ORF g.168389 m.168389 type:complete len:426 (-) comp31513_c0_seq1:96-1373(-)